MLKKAALIWAAFFLPATAGDLVFPVNCTLGQDCFIQQYVDRDPGPGIADFTCGSLTYQGHRGTDIRLIDNAAMEEGVEILSASPGRVLGVRDGVPDHSQGTPGAPDISRRECGNGVLVERADGWQFQYCHMRLGSLRVGNGDVVEAGTPLGLIGLSGQTQFPHLHLTIRDQARRVIDPFDRRQQNESCRLRDRTSLWRDLGPADYQPGGALAAGFSDAIPPYSAIRSGSVRNQTPDRDAPALVFWAHFFGLKAGDEITLSINDPDGKRLVASTHVMPRNRATEFRAAGKRARKRWTQGQYQGVAVLMRGTTRIARITRSIVLE